MPTDRPQLLVIAPGLGAAELRDLDGNHDVVGLDGLPADPLAVLAGPGSPAAALADLGVAIDDRDLWLRPAGRADADALARCGNRPIGPAAVTLVQARDVVRRAASGGLAAVPAAVRELEAAVAAVAGRLRQGDPPAVWWLGTGPLQAVHTTFDLATAVAQALPWPAAPALQLTTQPAVATLRAADRQLLAVAGQRLRHPPFARHLAVRPTPDGLQLLARPGVAFGRTPVAARLAAEPTGAAARLPGARRTAGDERLGFADFAARFWLSAARAAPEPEPVAPPAPAPTTGATAPANAGVAADPAAQPATGR